MEQNKNATFAMQMSSEPKLEPVMPSGVVERWFDDRGFGFIQPDDGGEQVFVHMKVLEDDNDFMTVGEAVEYEEEFDEASGKVKAMSCTGGYCGGEWTPPQRKGKGKGKSKGGFMPYGGKGKSVGGGGGGGVCRLFQNTGDCKFGDSCKFSH